MKKLFLPALLNLCSCTTQPVVTTGPLEAPAATRRYAAPSAVPALTAKPAPVHSGNPGYNNIEITR